MIPTKFIMLASHTFATATGPVTLRPGDVIAQSDFGPDLFAALWAELEASKKAVQYDAPSMALQAAHDEVLLIRSRAGDVEEGATSAIMLAAAIPGMPVP